MPLPENETAITQSIPTVSAAVTDGDAEPETAEPVGVQRTIMDRLRAQRDEQARHLTCKIIVPGYRGLLTAEYGVLETAVMTSIGRKISRQYRDDGDRQINAIMDVLLRANEGLYYVEEDGAHTPIDPNDSGTPITYTDSRTADFFGFEASSARECLLAVFGFNEMAMLAHGMRLSRWYEDTSKEVDENFLGE